MSAVLIRELTDAGVSLSRNGDRLHVEAKAGTLTADMRRKLSENKAALLAMLGDNLILDRDREMDAVNVPAGYTKPCTCEGCGPVLLWPTCPDVVKACPWCFRRRGGKPIPRPAVNRAVIKSNDKEVMK